MVREVIRELLIFSVLSVGFLFFLLAFTLGVIGLIVDRRTHYEKGCVKYCFYWLWTLVLGTAAGGLGYLLWKYLW